MWPFRMRADPEPEKTEIGAGEDALLRSILAADCMTRDQAMNVPAFAACVNKIAETVYPSSCISWWMENWKR